MLGAVGYSPVVSPHRIKQVCKPYQVVKVATEWYSVGSLDQWSLVSWQNCYDTVVFSLVLCIQLSGKSKTSGWYYCLLLCQDTDKSLCTDIKASVTKKSCQANTNRFHAIRHWLDTYIQKACVACLGIRNSLEVVRIPLRVSLSFNWELSDGLLVFTFSTYILMIQHHFLFVNTKNELSHGNQLSLKEK